MRGLIFACVVLVGVCGVLAAENAVVRRDQRRMLEAYEGFLSRRAGDKRLADLIKPSTLAVFRHERGMVGCAILGESNGK